MTSDRRDGQQAARRAQPPAGLGLLPSDIAAAALSVVWLIVAGGYFLFGGVAPAETGGARFLIVLLSVFLPVAMFWIAAMVVRTGHIMRAESARLSAAIDALRKSYLAQAQISGQGAETRLLRRLEELSAAVQKLDRRLSAALEEVDASHPAMAIAEAGTPAEEGQPALALGTQLDEIMPPMGRRDFIRALHFPQSADDRAGFAVLKRALKDRRTGPLVRAAQDILTLLSEDGIYMDDLQPHATRPETWRRFARGERGERVSGLAAIDDRTSLALASGRMKKDMIFRDAAHHFLRLFDKALVEFEKEATDAELSALAETRTARAFMLLGRVAGTFG